MRKVNYLMEQHNIMAIEAYVNQVFLKDVLALLRELPDKSIDMVYGDPDYNVGVKYGDKNYKKASMII